MYFLNKNKYGVSAHLQNLPLSPVIPFLIEEANRRANPGAAQET